MSKTKDEVFEKLMEAAPQALAGKDLWVCIYNFEGTDLLAIAGQQGLTLNRSKDSIDITSKDTKGGYKAKIGGMKEWSTDLDGLYVANHESHKILSKAFDDDEFICMKIINAKTEEAMFGGLSILTDYPIEAPYDDAVTFSASLEGSGPLLDLSDLKDDHFYTEEELDNLTKDEIMKIATSRGYTTVNISDNKDVMITAFLAEQGE